MIALDSSRWSKLRHAYGTAGDLPDLLCAIREDPDADFERTRDVWFRLWSSLCHQGDVFPASIAAVPHLVRIALEVSTRPMAPGLIELPVSIEESRMNRPHQISPEEIDSSYWEAVLRLEEVCVLAEPFYHDRRLMKAVEAARSLLKGRQGAPLPRQQSSADIGELFDDR